MKLADVTKNEPVAAPGTFAVPVSAFATTWDKRPKQEILVGFRLLAPDDRSRILKDATEHVEHNPDSLDLEEVFTSGLMRLVVAAVICDPNDVTQAHSVLPYPETLVFSALSDAGARLIFDAWQKFEVEFSPAHVEASPEEVTELFERLSEGGLSGLDEPGQSAALRHLAYALELLREADAA